MRNKLPFIKEEIERVVEKPCMIKGKYDMNEIHDYIEVAIMLYEDYCYGMKPCRKDVIEITSLSSYIIDKHLKNDRIQKIYI